jgi:hypothetical protein
VLTKLAKDESDLPYEMNSRRFSVELLTELAPDEDPGLLGRIVDWGHAIKLRIRTDLYDEFVSYSDIRRVLCHELSHNVWGDHGGYVSIGSQNTRIYHR